MSKKVTKQPKDVQTFTKIPPTTSQTLTAVQAGEDQSRKKQVIDMKDAKVDNAMVGVLGDVHPTYNYYNAPGKQPPTKETKVAAITKHQEEHMRSLGESVVLYDKTLKPNQLPDVHPGMHEYKAYEGEGPVEKEKFIPSTKQKFGSTFHQQPVSFDTLLNLTTRKKFITLVGPPGSGKTTLSKQLAKSQENYHVSSLVHGPKSVVFLLRFMDLNYREPLTCKKLFVDFLCPKLDKETKENAFQWMVENEDKCVFVFDGFDQTTISLENLKPTNVDYETAMPIDQLLANLCCKKFFKDSLLLFTSRPHKILKIPSELRPDVTIHVDDLSSDDMEKLFRALAGDKADELWKMVSTKAPQLFCLCHNPLLLQFIVFAILGKGPNNVKTVTEVFQTVLEQLRYSEHARNIDINELWKPLGKMAYEGMQEERVVFTHKNLGELDVSVVQNVIIAFARKIGFPNQQLFDGDQLFYFLHQTLQEIFSAKYICEFMPDKEFNDIIPEVAKGGHWSMVRRFLCGLLLGDKGSRDVQPSCKPAVSSEQLSARPANMQDGASVSLLGGASGSKSEKMDKAAMFHDKLIEYMKTNVRKYALKGKVEKFCPYSIEYMKTEIRGYDLIGLLTDLQECSDDEKNSLASHLPEEFSFSNTPISSSEAHALAEILPRLNQPVKGLYLHSCNLNSDTLRVIRGGISKMKHWVEELNLSCNDFRDPGVKIISDSGCLRKVKLLILGECRVSYDGKQILYRELKRLGLPVRSGQLLTSVDEDSDEENEFSDSDEEFSEES